MTGGTRRTWQEAKPAPTEAGFAIELDGRPLRLPGGAPLVLTSRALAAAIAREWESRPGGETIRPDDIPLTRLAGTAIERIAPDPEPTIAALGAYAATDLLCHRAAAPDALVRREEALWQPWLDWAAEAFGARLPTTTGVMPIAHDPEPLAGLRAALHARSVPELTALGLAVPALGSLVLGLALVCERIAPADAADAALLEERFQAELWGEDPIAAGRRAAITADITLAARYLALARA